MKRLFTDLEVDDDDEDKHDKCHQHNHRNADRRLPLIAPVTLLIATPLCRLSPRPGTVGAACGRKGTDNGKVRQESETCASWAGGASPNT